MCKRLLSRILVFCMVITLLPTVALATNAVSIWVGGVELTYKDAPIYAIMSGNTMTTDDADQNNYNVKFEVVDSVSTLTLHDFAYTGSGYEDVGLYVSLYAGIYAAGDLSIVLEGANSVTQRGGKRGYSYCIYSLGMLSISGSGSLAANGGEANDHSYGIYSADGISIIGGTVTADGGEAIAHSYGIYSDKDITVSGGAVTADGGETNSYSYGIYSAGGAITVSGGTVTANGGKAGGGSCGIYSDKDITVSDGTVTAYSDTSSCSYGINSFGGAIIVSGGTVTARCSAATGQNSAISANAGISITGGTVKAIAGKANVNYGISSPKDISITGGTVIATGGEATGASYGVYSSEDIFISSGTVTAEGGEADSASYGIYSNKGISVTDGTVTAKGGKAGGASFGIYSSKDISIIDGTVTGEGGKALNASFGIFSFNDIFITGGTVTAEGGVANLSQAMNKVPAATGDIIKAGTNSENATDDTYSSQKWVNISFYAQVSDFIITGTVGTDITPVTATITLDGVTFASTVNPDTTFDTNVAGISAQVTEVNSEKEVTVVISGHGENCGEGNMRVNLQSGTVSNTTRAFDTATNARAKYEIKTNKIIKRTTALNFTYNPVTYQNIYGEDKSANPTTTNITDTGEGMVSYSCRWLRSKNPCPQWCNHLP